MRWKYNRINISWKQKDASENLAAMASLLSDLAFLTRCNNLAFIMAVVSFPIHELDAERSDPAAQGGRSIFSSKEAKAKFS